MNPFIKNTVFILGFLFLFCSLNAYSEIYKWTDESGKVHFGDRPPANKTAEDITDSTKNTNVDTSQQEQSKLNKIFAKETPEEIALKNKNAQIDQQKSQDAVKRCASARKELEFLQKERFYTVDENGNDTTMSEQERKKLTKDYAELIKQHCGD